MNEYEKTKQYVLRAYEQNREIQNSQLSKVLCVLMDKIEEIEKAQKNPTTPRKRLIVRDIRSIRSKT